MRLRGLRSVCSPMCRLVARLLLSAPGLVTSLRTTSCSRCVSEASRICSGLPPRPPPPPATSSHPLSPGRAARAVLSHESRNDFVDVLATVLGIDQHDVGRDSRRERAGKSARGRRRDDFHRRAPFVDNPVQTQQSNAILANEHHAYWRSHPPPPSPLRSNSPGVKISDSWPAGYACP